MTRFHQTTVTLPLQVPLKRAKAPCSTSIITKLNGKESLPLITLRYFVQTCNSICHASSTSRVNPITLHVSVGSYDLGLLPTLTFLLLHGLHAWDIRFLPTRGLPGILGTVFVFVFWRLQSSAREHQRSRLSRQLWKSSRLVSVYTQATLVMPVIGSVQSSDRSEGNRFLCGQILAKTSQTMYQSHVYD